MKRAALGLSVLAAVIAAAFAPGWATATSTSRRVPQARSDLATQVRVLSAQVKALNTQVKALRKQVATNKAEISANYAGDACLTAIAADTLQGTWIVVDKVAQPALNTTFFGTPVPIDDAGACSAISVPRKQLQPATDSFSALVKWIAG